MKQTVWLTQFPKMPMGESIVPYLVPILVASYAIIEQAHQTLIGQLGLGTIAAFWLLTMFHLNSALCSKGLSK